MLTLRVASAAVAVPLIFATAYAGGWIYGVVLVAATMAGAWEAREMVRGVGREPLDPVLLGLAGILPFHAWFFVTRENGLPLFDSNAMVLVGLVVIGSLLLPLLRRRMEGILQDWALSLALGLYLGGLMQFYAPLRDRPDGDYWVIAAIGLSFVCDTTAFFAGRAFGRHRLAPHVSPKKSQEGAVAGVVGAIVVAIVWSFITGHSPLLLAGYGLVIAVATVFGDLAESMLKRQTGVKDSGALVPGHGGILDRMDSLLFCGPAAAVYLIAFGA